MTDKKDSPHIDRYTLLRQVAGELDEVARRRVERHLQSCSECTSEREALSELDRELTRHRSTVFGPETSSAPFDKDDPFRERPVTPGIRPSNEVLRDRSFFEWCLSSARAAEGTRDRLLSAEGADLGRLVASLDLEDLKARYGLGQALDEAPLRVAGGALRYRPLAESAVESLEGAAGRGARQHSPTGPSRAEQAYPLADLAGRAYLLDGIICNWTGELDRGDASFRRAWSHLLQGSASELLLATVELHEAQRRSFAGTPATGLALGIRAAGTFEEAGRGDDAARAFYAVAVALSTLGEEEQAIQSFRRAEAGFKEYGLWNPWISAINGAGLSLMELGRLEEARREYARALALTRGGRRPAIHALLRWHLARLLFQSGHVEEAAPAFRTAARLLAELGAKAYSLSATLFEVESLWRLGRATAARDLLARLEADVSSTPGLDDSILRDFRRQLSGEETQLADVSALREKASAEIRRRLEAV